MNILKDGGHGFVLPKYDIGLDATGRHSTFTFISHAHADHMPRAATPVFATPATKKLMQARGFKGEVKELDFFETIQTSEAQVTFFPAGHILGSAMTFVETDEGNLLYTGDFRTPASPTSEGFEVPAHVDILITEATFSLPIYRWASHELLFREIRQFAQNALQNGYTPVFLAYSLGKSQEVMNALVPLQHPVQVHGSAYPLCNVYTDMGFELGNYSRYNRTTIQGNILVTPSSGFFNGMQSAIKKARVAYVSGWATLESRRMQMNIDKRIPLSDHIDFFDLIEFCKRLQPSHVYITHTPNPDVVCHYLNKQNIPTTTAEEFGYYA